MPESGSRNPQRPWPGGRHPASGEGSREEPPTPEHRKCEARAGRTHPQGGRKERGERGGRR
eukprot:10858651-Lingulodinium_polyedra.AAC.1